MWWIGAAAVLSACLSAAALLIAFNNRADAPFAVPDELLEEFTSLKKAFRSLEADSEKMWDQVQSHLGRISRLKKTIPREFLNHPPLGQEAPAQTPVTLPAAPVQHGATYQAPPEVS